MLLIIIIRASILATVTAVIIGTIYDETSCKIQTDQNNNEKLQIVETKSKLRDIFICFSFTTNAKKVLTIVESSGENELKFLHGLRVMSICWVILCHTTNFAPLGLYDQPMIAGNHHLILNQSDQIYVQLVLRRMA